VRCAVTLPGSPSGCAIDLFLEAALTQGVGTADGQKVA
jgi:hypothetical protein